MAVGKLTKAALVEAEKRRVSQLTEPHEKLFKMIFSHQLESAHKFAALSSAGSATNTLKLMKAFGKFMDDTVKMTITDVEAQYKRKCDTRDGTYDPETQTDAQIEHFALYPIGAEPNSLVDSVRIHGYFRTGYFVVTRLDWYHSRH